MLQSSVTPTYQQQLGVPTSTYSQHTSDPYTGAASTPTSSFTQQSQVPGQLSTHMPRVSGAYNQQRSIGPDSFMSSNETSLVQHHVPMTPSQQVPKSIPMHQVASYSQQASTVQSTMQTVMV